MLRQVIFAAALLVTGCGGSPDLACDQFVKSGGVTGHGCTEINNIEPAQVDAAAKACMDQGGVVVDSCSSDGDLGVCSFTQAGLTIDIHFYSDGGVTVPTAEAACAQIPGTWTSN